MSVLYMQPSGSQPRTQGNVEDSEVVFSDAQRRLMASFIFEFCSNYRPIIEVDIDLSIVDRVDDMYIPQSRNYAKLMRYIVEETEDFVIETKLMSRCALFNKLVSSSPSFIKIEIPQYESIVSRSPLTTAFIKALYDNYINKEDKRFNVRVKHLVYDINMMALEIIKTSLLHSRKQWFYSQLSGAIYDIYIPGKVHFGDTSSTNKLRSPASQYLEEIYSLEIPIKMDGKEGVYGYPILPISEDSDIMAENYICWTHKLSCSFPCLEFALHVGLLTFARDYWFGQDNLNTSLSELVPGANQHGFNITPNTLLNCVDWTILRCDNDTFLRLLSDAFNYAASYFYYSRQFAV